MNYWLICLPREDMNHCIEVGVFGLSRRHTIGKVRQGDQLICCASKGEWKIIAFGEATSDYYIDDSNVFLKPGYFVDRFQFKASLLSQEIALKDFIDRLSFVTHLAHWPVYFRNGIAKCSIDDWNLVTQTSTHNFKTLK